MQQAPRPGVSYIPNADAEQPPRTERGSRAAAEPLPQVPRFERALPDNPPAVVAEPRAQQYEAERMMRRHASVADESMGNPAQPRFERADRIERAAPQSARMDERMAPREMAPPPRQAYEPPRREAAPAMQPPPAAAPPPHEEAAAQRPPPKRSEW